MIRTFVLAALVLSASLCAASPRLAAAERAALSPDQSAAVRRAVRYLNGLSTLQARFIQVSSNGAYAEGEVIVQRPGKMRFDYDPPHPVLIIANGLSLLFYDRGLKQASFLPLWETPRWFLIRERVTLSEDVMVTRVAQGLGTLSITIEDRQMPEAGSVTLPASAILRSSMVILRVPRTCSTPVTTTSSVSVTRSRMRNQSGVSQSGRKLACLRSRS